MTTIRIATAQLNPTVGDLVGNTKKIIDIIKKATEFQARVVVFPELALTGYPPQDLLLRQSFIKECYFYLEQIVKEIGNIYVILGHVVADKLGIRNAAIVIYNRKIISQYYKTHLPNYGVFDEKRYFIPGDGRSSIFSVDSFPIGILICEDLWEPGLVKANIDSGAKIILSLNASPFHIEKHTMRENILRERYESEGKIPIVYLNLVGGQDEIVFDGNSFLFSADGQITYISPAFQEHLGILDVVILNSKKIESIKTYCSFAQAGNLESIYQSLVLGVRDYINKNNLAGGIIGLSGGIDSALSIAIAVDAVGPERIMAVSMPSPYTAPISIEDAELQAKALGVKCIILPIRKLYSAFLESLSLFYKSEETGITEQNLQARCRGVVLMAISNITGKVVLNTSNKSECAVGYSTIYGDSIGAFAILKDVTKTLVYQLANYRNTLSPVIPARVIERPPSAELAPNQVDQDNLPPYEILDKILVMYIEEMLSIDEIVSKGYSIDIVKKVCQLIQNNEFKRSQSPIGTKISPRAFGKDWRFPITSRRTVERVCNRLSNNSVQQSIKEK